MPRHPCRYPVRIHIRSTVSSPFRDMTVSGLNYSSRLLWAFDIVLGPNDPTPDPEKYINHGLVREPAPFQFALRPRDPDALKVLQFEAAEADIRLKEWE